MRARRAVAVTAAVAAAATVTGTSTSSAVTGGTTRDMWSNKVTMKTPDGWFASPVNSALLPDGRILMFGLQRPVDPPTADTKTARAAWIFTPTPYGQPVSPDLTLQMVEEPIEVVGQPTADGWIEDDLFCAGQVLTTDGLVFTAGGNLRVVHESSPSESYGVDYETLFNYETDAWTRLQKTMQGTSPTGGKSRWYPTVTKLPDGRMLIQGGFDKVLPNAVWNGTAEVWDPNSQDNVVISPYGWTPPEVMNSTYTHAFVLPTPVNGKDVIDFGEPGVPVLFDPATSSWQVRNDQPRPGSEQWNLTRVQGGRWHWDSSTAPDWGASTAMLPIRLNNGAAGYDNGALIVAGGSTKTQQFGDIDTYDPITNTWRPGKLQVQRNFPITIDLPDGRMLVLGGGGTTDPNLRHAEYFDPATGTSTLGSADGGEVRGYHATALLLPDGRVFIGGGRDVSKADTLEKPSFRYYYPDYMFKDRPQLYIAPSELKVATPYALWTNRPVQELVMVALGSQTHSVDMNQRAVQVPVLANIAAGGYNVVIGGGLPGPLTLPPGFYMLFALDQNHVPSIAKIVKVDPVNS